MPSEIRRLTTEQFAALLQLARPRLTRTLSSVHMPHEVRLFTTDQSAELLQLARPRLTRTISSVHLHHTWRPTQSQFKGLATIEAMRHFHVNTNGWDDIAQHLTIYPQGFSWTG